jgi:hypothetical protein
MVTRRCVRIREQVRGGEGRGMHGIWRWRSVKMIMALE